MTNPRTILSQDLRWARLQVDPTCRVCGITKTIADFPRRAVDYGCNACRRVQARDYYRKRVATASPEALADMRAATNEKQNRRRVEYLAALPPEQLMEFRTQLNAGNSARRYVARDKAYQAYGGYVCACCGETERTFLSIDHVNNDGAAHKRKFKLQTGEQMYRWLARNNFPPGFQILCMNCQWGKRNNNGICPHQVRCNDHPVEGVGPSGPKRSAPASDTRVMIWSPLHGNMQQPERAVLGVASQGED
jgi:hypothetical protein